MLHLIRTGHGAVTPYLMSWARHHSAHAWAETLTAAFAHPRCPDCCSDRLLPNVPAHRNAVLFVVLSTEANLD
jgi:hypothetical protein